ncbi:phage tail protein I [Paracoccus aestuariivivens]|uniref:Phage tail protein I n=1 Tax=Paracoccus aestuariivivens TaxID=1820333 RepID=A0A6L6JF37_9RHOB|nr:phage tail protein I [Paracoccus aestuariivivens]MTH78754.1 phage tail protein I [Paracoccus aestuariivivens]
MTETLLPSNATAAEIALDLTTARIVEHGAPLRSIWNPDSCPVEMLPWLAWALGVDEWDAEWSEEAKRDTIRESVSVHRRKGTVGAIRRVLINAGYGDAEIIERWAERTYDGSLLHDGSETYASADHWAEYRVKMARPITLSQAQKVRAILDAIAPLRCHLKQLDFQQVTYLYDATLRYDGAASHGAA